MAEYYRCSSPECDYINESKEAYCEACGTNFTPDAIDADEVRDEIDKLRSIADRLENMLESHGD